ncbi:MAG TPA: hypothetical protein VGH77_17815 [Streptosporangiaceae bacterium]
MIRTRRIPFFRSRPSLPLTLATLGVVLIGALLPFTPLARVLGFQPLPGLFLLALTGMVIGYWPWSKPASTGSTGPTMAPPHPRAAVASRATGCAAAPPASPRTVSGHAAGPSATGPRPPPARAPLPGRQLGQTARYSG